VTIVAAEIAGACAVLVVHVPGPTSTAQGVRLHLPDEGERVRRVRVAPTFFATRVLPVHVRLEELERGFAATVQSNLRMSTVVAETGDVNTSVMVHSSGQHADS
jgi:hypothetical protein